VTPTPLPDRLAGAPISFGVCEVPGWGFQLDRERVFGEIHTLGLRATEAGPDGYLPRDPAEARELLDRHELDLVGGFLPLVLHDRRVVQEQIAVARRKLEWLAAAGGGVLVTAAIVDRAWAPRIELAAPQWRHLLAMFDRLDELSAERGLVQAVHPHVGTLVESAAETQRVLDGCAAGLCLDTGHLTIGGANPAALVAAHPGRIVHVHLKDVDRALAGRVGRGELSLMGATQQRLFRPLGTGDAPIGEVIGQLERSGYAGWVVLEQDCALTEAPVQDAGPAREVRRSIEYLGVPDARRLPA
jgi:inosose dehydratase